MLEADDLDPYTPDFNGEERITCLVLNYEGTREAVKMARFFWAYLYWLDANGHMDANHFISRTSWRFPTLPLQKTLQNCLAEMSSRRWRQGKPRPVWAGALIEMPPRWDEFLRDFERKDLSSPP